MDSNSAPFSVPNSWKVTTLGQLAKETGGTIQTGPFGSQLHAEDYVQDGIPSIMPKNITPNGVDTTDIARITEEDACRLVKYRVKNGDIIYSRRGDVEKCAKISEREGGWLCGTGCLIVRINPTSFSSDYLHAYLNHPSIKEWIRRHAVGATMPNLNTSILSELPVVIPDPETLEQVENIWVNLSRKITLLSSINQTLEEMAQAIFKSWFVDFDPVKAKAQVIAQGGSEQDANLAAMQIISGKTRDQLAALERTHPEQYTQLHTTASLFPSAFVESELGEIPDGWKTSNIGNEVKIVGGGTPSTKNPEYWGNGIHHWTTPKDLSNASSKVLITTDRKITNEGLGTISSGLLPKNTVLMSSRAPVGYLALAKIPVAINQGYIAMVCDKKLSPEFVLQWANSMMDEIKQRASGTTFPEISKNTFRSIPAVVPTDEILNLFTSKVKPIYSQIETNELAKNHLKEIRDGLLPKLLSGEIEV